MIVIAPRPAKFDCQKIKSNDSVAAVERSSLDDADLLDAWVSDRRHAALAALVGRFDTHRMMEKSFTTLRKQNFGE